MNKRRPYETADTLVYDPVASNRNATRASLHSLGFRRVELAPALDVLESRLRLQSPDLLLVEVAGAETDVCRLIQSVRQGLVGANPFLVTMVTTWRRDGTIVGQIVDSGADDLVARPFSTTVLGERIRLQVERRKSFVITSDYVGPDRRRDAGRPGSAPTMDAPNTLKLRTEELSEEEAERRIVEDVTRGRTLLNAEKAQRDAVQLCCQWRILEHRNPRGRDFRDILARMEKIAREIGLRVKGTANESVTQTCDQLIDTAVSIGAKLGADGPSAEPLLDLSPWMHRIGEAATALHRALAPGEPMPARLVEIDGPAGEAPAKPRVAQRA